MHPRKAVTAASLLAVTSLVLVACGGGDDSAQASTTLNVSLPHHTWTTAIEEHIPEFEEEFGLTVNLTTFGEDQLSDQYNVKLNTGSSDFDVMMYRPLQEGKLFVQNGWLSNLDEGIDGAGDWDWSDFQEGPAAAVTGDDGSVYGIPLVTEREVLYYNTEILSAAGLEVPTTLEELEATAAAAHDPANGVYGFVARGQRAAAVTQFSSFLYSFGGDFDSDGQATLDTPEARAAYEFYSGLLREYGPPGTTDMSWAQALPVFAQGQAAFYTDADSLYANFEDPATSNVIDKVGFALFPAGDAGSRPYNIPSWALGINEFSTNKDNAWTFVQWATSPEVSLAIQQTGVPLARSSVWENPEGVTGFPEQLASVIQASAEVGVGHDRPVVVKVGEARDIVGEPIVVGITGGDVAGAVEAAQSAYQAFLDEENG